ncbi:MAG: FAD-binding oxidoreductase [Gammaproteobacteria bacterium]|nr:FAD-binding oxidoreductase [Gammaproteobacteria bacterium]
MSETKSQRPKRRFWGWGLESDELAPMEVAIVKGMMARLGLAATELPRPPVEDDFSLPAPRVAPPSSLASAFSSTAHDRLTHSYGKSFADSVRMWNRDVRTPPDWVAFPDGEQAIADVLDWAGRENVAVVPYGGGSSVCGGVEPAVGDAYRATVSLDLERLNRVLEIDRASRSARIEAGILGPELEAQLRPHGLTLRHFPQSLQFSTLGGWIVTRSGGHYATLYTHIDEFVQSVRMVAPAGVLETRRLPGGGAGPDPNRLVTGSEGVLGVVTEAWMRLQDRPRFRASASVRFRDVMVAANCVRALAQSGLNPTNCRLLDPAEVAFAGVGDGTSPMLVLGFESADHALHAWMGRALELVRDFGGEYDAAAGERSMRSAAPDDEGEHRKGAAGQWRDAFIRMPYWRDPMVGAGAILDTFETAITWDRFESFYRGVLDELGAAIRRATDRPGSVSCRFTHVYPDGPAPYFTYAALGSDRGDLASSLAAWREIKLAANDVVTRLGGTVTHHHAVGRDHRTGYEQESSSLYRAALGAAKASLDPQGILNPGVLIDPVDRPVGITGALGPRSR